MQRIHDRSTCREGVGRRPGGRGGDQAVSGVGGERLAVERHPHPDGLAAGTPLDDYFVEGMVDHLGGSRRSAGPVHLDPEHHPLLEVVFASQYPNHRSVGVGGLHGRQIPQLAVVHPQDRSGPAIQEVDGPQDRPVPAQAHHQIRGVVHTGSREAGIVGAVYLMAVAHQGSSQSIGLSYSLGALLVDD